MRRSISIAAVLVMIFTMALPAGADSANGSDPYVTLTDAAPAGSSLHPIINSGDTTMRILWVYGATEVTRTFADTGETVPQFHNPHP